MSASVRSSPNSNVTNASTAPTPGGPFADPVRSAPAQARRERNSERDDRSVPGACALPEPERRTYPTPARPTYDTERATRPVRGRATQHPDVSPVAFYVSKRKRAEWLEWSDPVLAEACRFALGRRRLFERFGSWRGARWARYSRRPRLVSAEPVQVDPLGALTADVADREVST